MTVTIVGVSVDMISGVAFSVLPAPFIKYCLSNSCFQGTKNGNAIFDVKCPETYNIGSKVRPPHHGTSL